MKIVKGQKVDLMSNNPGLSQVTVNFSFNESNARLIAFLLSKDGKVIDSTNFVSFNQRTAASGSIECISSSQFVIRLSSIPLGVEKISFALIAPQEGASGISLNLLDTVTNNPVLQYDLAESISANAASLVCEVYRYKGTWKFGAVGNSVKGGLKAICQLYGVSEQEVTKPAESEPIVHKPVELRKGQKVSLKKQGSSFGEILINLNWNQRPSSGVSLFKPKSIDLDLGCLYELKNGSKGAVQALGNAFGSLTNSPFVALDGDDRTGANSAGENLRVNGQKVSEIKRLLIYTFIYEGAADWQEADGIVTVKCPSNSDVIVRMDEYGSRKIMCAIALFENSGETFSVQKVVQFFKSHKEMDKAFSWGLRWVHGSK